MSWERRHSPLTREGGLEDVARFADGLRRARRSAGQQKRVRQFVLTIFIALIAVALVAVIGGAVTAL